MMGNVLSGDLQHQQGLGCSAFLSITMVRNSDLGNHLSSILLGKELDHHIMVYCGSLGLRPSLFVPRSIISTYMEL
jgi:hypothetical protein